LVLRTESLRRDERASRGGNLSGVCSSMLALGSTSWQWLVNSGISHDSLASVAPQHPNNTGPCDVQSIEGRGSSDGSACVGAAATVAFCRSQSGRGRRHRALVGASGKCSRQTATAVASLVPPLGRGKPSDSAAIGHRTEPAALGLGARQTQRGGARMARTSTEQGATSRSAAKGGPIASPKKTSHAIAIFGRPAPRSNEPRRINSATPILQSVCQQGPEARVGRGRAKRSNRTGGGGGSVRLDQGPTFNSPKPSPAQALVIHPGTYFKE
jgi:hypothetical protein